jgi:hypothetical protein
MLKKTTWPAPAYAGKVHVSSMLGTMKPVRVSAFVPPPT